MTKKIHSAQGMLDILPDDIPLWHHFEEKWRALVRAYSYEEIRFPILEFTGLFKRTIGEVTDIVEKEMFTVQMEEDKESLSLRPEGTAGCVRTLIEHNLFRHHPRQRFWYMGPMFRHEKPQMGRYRQFTHAGIEAFNLVGPDIDAELILMTARLWQALEVSQGLTLQINSLGSKESRLAYRSRLVDYLSTYENDLDEDSKRRLKTNPLRILDSKNPAMASIIAGSPKCYDYLDEESKKHFEGFQQRLTDAKIAYQLNPNLVRGLDYYNRTVFEWVTDKLGAQGTVCAGGRYDSLVEQLGGGSVPAVGFAVGIERVLLLQKSFGHKKDFTVDGYFIHLGEGPEKEVLNIAEKLRDTCPGLRLLVHCGGGNFKKQFEKADKSGAKVALILGETEWAQQIIGIKFLREDRPQLSLSYAKVGQFLTEYLGE
jgi:histidyl-tRNA synthetase